MLALTNNYGCSLYTENRKEIVIGSIDECIEKIVDKSCLVVDKVLVGQFEDVYLDGDHKDQFAEKLKQKSIWYEIVTDTSGE